MNKKKTLFLLRKKINLKKLKLKLHILSTIFIATLFACQHNSPLKTEKFKVWGNCEKCKVTIENASNLVGVSKKNWDIESKLMVVTFDTTKVSLDRIQESIAKSGYDNDKYFGDDYAYAKLATCCQYERKSYE